MVNRESHMFYDVQIKGESYMVLVWVGEVEGREYNYCN